MIVLCCSRPNGVQCSWCTLSHRLRLSYLNSGKSLRQLERAAYISDSTIYRYFSRRTLPSLSMLKHLVAALDGNQQEFELLWKRAKVDQCRPLRRDLESDESVESALASAKYSWIDTLNSLAREYRDPAIARYSEGIVTLTLLIDNTTSDEAISHFQQARASCWLEIADHIDVCTPASQMCAMACRSAAQIDRTEVLSARSFPRDRKDGQR